MLNGNISDAQCGKLREINGSFEYDEDKKTGRIIAPIKREQESIIKRICAEDGDYSETEFKVLKSGEKFSVLEVYPKTGRTHQIRLHFYTIGLPLLGEDLYCANTSRQINRHALHAYSLEFNHPENNKKMLIICELPGDMNSIIDKI